MDAAAQRHQQLKNEANKMAMKIPFFHGDDKEDALDIKEMIRRFENSADAMGLADNAEKCNMFGNYLRGPAAVIWEGMDFYGESKVDWNSVKKYFLKEYQGEVDVETFTFKIGKLIQGSNESAVNFGGRCLQSVYEQYKSIPVPPPEVLNADGAAVAAPGKLNIHQATLKMVTDITARSLFLTGLKENLRTLTMQKTILTLREAIDEAAKQEKLLKNKNELKGRIAVLADMEDEELEDQELDEDTVNKINNTRARQGKQPYRRFNNFRGNKPNGQGVRSGSTNGNKNGNQQNRDDWKCRYCNAPGHMQADCRKRKTAGAPLVDRNGKPLGGNNKGVREVADSKATDDMLGHLQQSSGQGCRLIQNQDTLNF